MGDTDKSNYRLRAVSPTNLINKFESFQGNYSPTFPTPTTIPSNNYDSVGSISNCENSKDEENDPRSNVKTFLNKVKNKIPSKEFKTFVKYIKILTDKKAENVNKKEIFIKVQKIFGKENRELYNIFETLLSKTK